MPDGVRFELSFHLLRTSTTVAERVIQKTASELVGRFDLVGLRRSAHAVRRTLGEVVSGDLRVSSLRASIKSHLAKDRCGAGRSLILDSPSTRHAGSSHRLTLAQRRRGRDRPLPLICHEVTNSEGSLSVRTTPLEHTEECAARRFRGPWRTKRSRRRRGSTGPSLDNSRGGMTRGAKPA